MSMEVKAYAVIRSDGSGGQRMDVSTVRDTYGESLEKSRQQNALAPGWAAANPVIKVVPVVISPVEDSAA
jgi:hypothetical protein